MSTLISTQLVQHITADSAVSAIITDRCFNGDVTQDTLIPLVVVTRTERDTGPYRGTDGNGTRARYSYQIDCYGRTAQQTEELADAVVAAVDGFTSANIFECYHDRDYRNDSDDEYRTTVEIVIHGDR